MPDIFIQVQGLDKRFGATRALDGLDFEVAAGEVHGLLGPNGSGKSTAIRVMLGLLRADGGSITLLGGDPWRDAVKLHRNLAYVPGDVNLWPNLTGGECIDLLGQLRGGHDRARVEELLVRFELDPTKKFAAYSKGNRQKVALVAALASDVDLYILDEPTSGLDPLMESVFQEHVHELKEDGRTVVLSSHILAEVEALCDRVTMIRHGKTIETGSLPDLKRKARTTLAVETKGSPAALKGVRGVHELKVTGNRATFQTDDDAIQDIMQRLVQLGVKSLTSAAPTLEHLFLRHYSDRTDSADPEEKDAG